MTPSRRTVLSGLAMAALAPALAACGDSASSGRTSTDAADDPTDGPTDGPEAGAFPATITHKFGSTTLTRAPERVVSVGLVEQDALLALGIVPIAVTKWFGDAPGQIFPWAQNHLHGARLPQVLDGDDGVQVEKVAALAPDLIIGQYAGITRKEYALLSKIAPTVVQSGKYADYGMPWEESTRNVAAAVGRPKAGQKLVDGVNARIDREAAEHPEFADKLAVCVTPYEGLFVYGPEDPRGRILDRLGFRFPQKLQDPSSKAFGWSLSAERTTDLQDVDAVVWLGTEKEIAKGTGGLWARTTAAREGRGVFIGEPAGDYYVAHSMVTVLSIPYVLDRYVPQILAAQDGDPTTKVPVSAA